MTDDNDRTQEIRRDPDQFRPAGQDSSAAGRDSAGRDASPARSEDTAVFDRPSSVGPQRPAPGPGPEPREHSGDYPPAGGGYQPAPSARPTQPAQGYGAPMVPSDRGSGGFPAAIIGAVVATLVAVATSFGAYQILTNHSSIDPQKVPGYLTYRMNVLPWPSGRGGGDVTTAFVVGILIVLAVTLLLMMAAAMSTRAGTGGFALFLAAWMASVVAGGVARPVAGVIARQGSYPSAEWQSDISTGVLWGVVFGWIAALVLLIVHAMRRKPVMR